MGTHFNTYTYTYTHSHAYSEPHSYTYTNAHSINYSYAQSDSQVASHATSTPDAAVTQAWPICFSSAHSNGDVIRTSANEADFNLAWRLNDRERVKRNVDGNGNPSSNQPHETKNEWPDFCALLFWSGTVFR